MSTALLTFLGGMRDKAEKNKPVYQRANYEFPSGTVESTDYFAAALRQQHDFEQILVFGTKTSIWEKLAQDAGDEELALEIFSQTEQELDGEGVRLETLGELQQLLSAEWETEVFLCASESSITSENVEDEMMRYVEMLQKIRTEEVLFDFTHGFRSMPMLLSSAVNFWQSLDPVRKPIKMVYGEFNKGGNSNVHYLDGIHQSLKVAQAVRLFFEKMDGSELAQLVHTFWPSGERALSALTMRLQENRLNQIEEPLRQLSNALKHMSHPEDAPAWFNPIRLRLTEWTKNIQQNNLPLTLASLAWELRTNRLHAQAIMALDEALLEAILMARKQSSENLTAEERNKIFKEALRDLEKELGDSLWKLHNLRNFVAHGARPDRKQQGRPVGSPSGQLPQFFQLLQPILANPERYFALQEVPDESFQVQA